MKQDDKPHNNCNNRIDNWNSKQPTAFIWQYINKLHFISAAHKHSRRVTGNRLKWLFIACDSVYTMVFRRDIRNKAFEYYPNSIHTAVCSDICR